MAPLVVRDVLARRPEQWDGQPEESQSTTVARGALRVVGRRTVSVVPLCWWLRQPFAQAQWPNGFWPLLSSGFAPPKDAHRTARQWLRAPSAATRRLQQVCDPALEPSRAALPGAHDSAAPLRASQPTATSFLWPGRSVQHYVCAVQLLRINRYIRSTRAQQPQ